MYKLTVESQFSGAHRLIDYPGPCHRVHGHNWKVRVTVAADKLGEIGMVIDLMELQQHLNDVLGQFDHREVNTVPPFDKLNPTSENLAKYFYDELSARLPVDVQSVQVSETDDFYVTYEPE